MKNGVCNRTRHARNADLADAASAERTKYVVVFYDETNVNCLDVCVNGHMVLRKISVHESAVALVEHAMLEQRHAHSPNDAALQLTARCLFVHELSHTVDRVDARHLQHARLLINANLREYSTKRTAGELLLL